ncbi:hypothetical protein HYR99_16865 [Candidatus Poribacteria bacterium]|nr:hypothetical protein [Candidatus Poribacteria bacterium]
MKDLFLLAACVGHQKGQRVCLKKRRDVFNWAQFTAQEDIPVLRALALAETGSVEVLINTDYLLTIAEEYANGGIGEIKNQVLEMPGKPIESLVNFLMQAMPMAFQR